MGLLTKPVPREFLVYVIVFCLFFFCSYLKIMFFLGVNCPLLVELLVPLTVFLIFVTTDLKCSCLTTF